MSMGKCFLFKFNWKYIAGLCLVLSLCVGCGAVGADDKNADAGSLPAEKDGGMTGQSKEAEDGASSESETSDERVQIPDFELTLLDGETVSFEDYRGKKVLLNFWATWCGPCVGEMPAFQKLAEEYPDELIILAVNCGEDQATVQTFAEDNGYTFPIVMDTEGVIQAMFGGITSIPVTVIIDEEGYLVSASTGAADADTMYEAYKEALGF